MSVAKQFGGTKLAKLAMTPHPDRVEDGLGNVLHIQLSGFVQVWDMDVPSLARPNGGNEVTRCDFAVFQSRVSAGENMRYICLVEFTNSIGGDTGEKVQRQLKGGLQILLAVAEGENDSFDELTPIFIYGRSVNKRDMFAFRRISLTGPQGKVGVILCKSGGTLKDKGVVVQPVN